MPDRDPLDRLLDDALTTYADPGPALAPGVLAHIAARNAASRRTRWFWAAGLATAAAVLLLILVPSHTTLPPHTAPRTQAAASPSPKPVEHAATALPAHHAAPHMRPAEHRALPTPAPLPRQQTFPAPSPLTNQEQALIQLVSALPPKQQKHLMETQQQPVEPLRIAAISIPPLEPAPQTER